MAKPKDKKDKDGGGTIALNKRARYDYHIDDRYEAGLVLQGWEVKSIRAGRVNFGDAYALIKANWIALEPPGRTRLKDGMNRLSGRILSLRPGKTSAEVELELKGGARVVAMTPSRGLRTGGLAEGKAAVAVFAASDVILGVTG